MMVELESALDCSQRSPVRIPFPAGVDPPRHCLLREEGGTRVFPGQVEGDALVALVEGIGAGEKLRFRVVRAPASPGVSVRQREGGAGLSLALPEGPFTTYHADPGCARPYFYPVLGPGGRGVTRGYPMKEIPGETRDHPHHRSLWTAYGETSGVDNWSEAAGKHGWTRHRGFARLVEGPVWGGFTAEAVWTAPDGREVLGERRSVRLYNVGPERRLLDYDVDLVASFGDVHYGDTKEGGILAVRVATTMDGSRGGRITNSLGGTGEKECWGKRAAWLDYSGPVEGETLGIAMMDHPGNFRHPCYWHARDYGLVGTNPFARAAFEKGPPEGALQKQGETLRFRYRLLIHRGDARQARVSDAYHAWVQPPAGKIAA